MWTGLPLRDGGRFRPCTWSSGGDLYSKAAKKAFDELGVKKLPTVKSLQVEFTDLLTAKDRKSVV